MVGDVLAVLVEAQRRNETLSGADLTRAADAVARLAKRHKALLVADDPAGERILGACLAIHSAVCHPADVSERLDNQALILVSGMIAAPHALNQGIARLKSFGAGRVHVAVLGGWSDPIPGAATVVGIGGPISTSSAA